MKINISTDAESLGKNAAKTASKFINRAINKNGFARILLSTGASQFETLSHLVKMDIDWQNVEMFHLDEYISLSESHPASFRKYLKERFLSHANVKKAHLINGESDVDKTIAELTDKIREKPIDVALIGIGENGHIAFNDPPADFSTKAAYIKVNLDDKCKQQQVGEGWFTGIEEVPDQAISMSVFQIMVSRVIITCVPHAVKAQAIADTLSNPQTNMIPATILKKHKNWHLFLDNNSASGFIK